MPKSETLPPENSQEIERVQKLVLALDRTLRSSRLYSDNNPILQRHRTDLIALFNQYFANQEELNLTVQPFELTFGESVVYKNPDQQDGFAFRLFNDGIRTLTFRQGLAESELAEFLRAITAELSAKTTDSDAVTRFWEREFEHIRYTVADTIVDEPTLDDKSTNVKIEELLDPTMSQYQGAGESGDDDDITQDLKITLNLPSVGKMFSERAVMSPEELQRIQADIRETDRPERLTLDFVDMVLAVLQEERNLADYERCLDSLGMVLDHNFLLGQLHISRMVMDQVHQFPTRSIELAKSDPNLLPHTLRKLWPAARVDLFIQCLNQEPTGTAQDILALVALIDPGVLPHLVKSVNAILDQNRRRIVCQGIAQLHRGDIGMFVPMLTSKDEEVVRSGIHILAGIQNEKVLDILATLLSHPQIPIRKEAIAVLRNFQSPKAYRLLTGLLVDSNHEIRLLALRILGTCGSREVAQQLTAAINRPDFIQKALNERKAYFQAIARIAKDDFVPYLQSILATKTWFHRTEQDELYQCAALGLCAVGSSQARKVLETFARSGNKTIRRYSENALRLLRETPEVNPS